MSLHRFDHAQAKAYFVSLDPGQRTDQAVATKFRVTRPTIAKARRSENWEAAAAEADRRAAAKALEATIKSREQRAVQDARIRDRAADLVERKLQAEDVGDDWVMRVLADADKRVRLNEGDATENVAVATVQAGFREAQSSAVEKLVELVTRGLAGEDLIRGFRAEYPALVVERLNLIEGDES